MKTRYIYPCLVNYDEADKIYYVQFIDIPEAFTDGDTLEEAIINAKDVLELCLYEYIKIAKEIPGPTQKAIKTNENEKVVSFSPVVEETDEEGNAGHA